MMKYLFILIMLLLCSYAAYSQFDEDSQRLLDSMGVTYDPNDPDAEQKLMNDLKEAYLKTFNSAMEEASNTETDPFNTAQLASDIVNDFNEGSDTTTADLAYMQETPILEINLANPDPRFYTSDGFTLPEKLSILIVQGNGSGETVDMVSLLSNLSAETIRELYLINDKQGISELPEEIGNLTNLKILALFGNAISSLPASLGNLSKLEELYIDANPFERLPDTVFSMKSLKVLGIAQTTIGAEDIALLKQQLPNCKILLQ